MARAAVVAAAAAAGAAAGADPCASASCNGTASQCCDVWNGGTDSQAMCFNPAKLNCTKCSKYTPIPTGVPDPLSTPCKAGEACCSTYDDQKLKRTDCYDPAQGGACCEMRDVTGHRQAGEFCPAGGGTDCCGHLCYDSAKSVCCKSHYGWGKLCDAGGWCGYDGSCCDSGYKNCTQGGCCAPGTECCGMSCCKAGETCDSGICKTPSALA